MTAAQRRLRPVFGYIADEMNLGAWLGPMAMESKRFVKINSTCTVFAGAELRDRLSMGQSERTFSRASTAPFSAPALLARSGGIADEFTFTGGVANNTAAVDALRTLVRENYGERRLNISANSIHTRVLSARRSPAARLSAGTRLACA